jgi:hypothetical protein
MELGEFQLMAPQFKDFVQSSVFIIHVKFTISRPKIKLDFTVPIMSGSNGICVVSNAILDMLNKHVHQTHLSDAGMIRI